MGSALIQGALSSGFLKAQNITAFDVEKKRLEPVKKKFKIRTAGSSLEAVQKADFVFLCVKPQQMKELLREIRIAVRPKQCLISIAAGIPSLFIEQQFLLKMPVIRVMPNTPALIQSGVSVLTKGRFAGSVHLAFAKRFFTSVSDVLVLPEKHFDVVTAVSGSGPAYLFYLTESLTQAARESGLSAKIADRLARGTVMGAAKMLKDGTSPEELRVKVTSPGGTTEAAVRYLQSKNWARHFVEAVQKAAHRSKELREML